MQEAAILFDRTQGDVGNMVEFGHVNLQVPDHRLATLFYISGLGLTRDPFLMTGIDIMWVNVGAAQFHLPCGPAQVLRGTIGIVVPDLDALAERLAKVAGPLAGTGFQATRGEETVDVVCPWGNRFRCHAPGPRWPNLALGIPYVELDVPQGTAERIANFYHVALLTPVTVEPGRARVAAGMTTDLVFVETAAARPAWDGQHIQVTLANFSGPYAWLTKRRLITREDNVHQYRFVDVVDVDSGVVLTRMEHEVRSMRHPLYGRPLVNRNADQSPRHFRAGHEQAASMLPAS
jgi:hypothetical protein